MSDTERSLLDAVLENPDDDLPRLVYADFLEEHGDATRAEFIRSQVALTNLISCNLYDSEEYGSVCAFFSCISEQTYVTLLNTIGVNLSPSSKLYVDYTNEWARIKDYQSQNQYHFRRGFIHTVIAHDQWCAVHPIPISNQPIELIRFQPHVGSHTALTIKKTTTSQWHLIITRNCSLYPFTKTLEFGNRREAIQQLYRIKEKDVVSSIHGLTSVIRNIIDN